jgi:hypothetical protein
VSLGIAFKGAEGIVLAADSRVTLTTLRATLPNFPAVMLPSTFDNATKLLSVEGQKFVGAVTFGAGAIGQQAPRTAASFMPEFEEELAKYATKNNKKRMSVAEFAEKLGEFFMDQWTKGKMPNPTPPGNEMVFLVGGYNEKEAYGRVYSLSVPTAPKPIEQSPDLFGATWGGQRELVDRLIQGFDPSLPQVLAALQPGQAANANIQTELKNRLTLPIPWQFLPLQDCVDLCIFLVRTTIQLQKWLVSVRGVGGAIDVATITRTGGFKAIQIKEVTGDAFSPMQ